MAKRKSTPPPAPKTVERKPRAEVAREWHAMATHRYQTYLQDFEDAKAKFSERFSKAVLGQHGDAVSWTLQALCETEAKASIAAAILQREEARTPEGLQALHDEMVEWAKREIMRGSFRHSSTSQTSNAVAEFTALGLCAYVDDRLWFGRLDKFLERYALTDVQEVVAAVVLALPGQLA